LHYTTEKSNKDFTSYPVLLRVGECWPHSPRKMVSSEETAFLLQMLKGALTMPLWCDDYWQVCWEWAGES